jgi:hypothetical protein
MKKRLNVQVVKELAKCSLAYGDIQKQATACQSCIGVLIAKKPVMLVNKHISGWSIRLIFFKIRPNVELTGWPESCK